MKVYTSCLLTYPFDTGLDLDFEKLVRYKKSPIPEVKRYYLGDKTPVEIFHSKLDEAKLDGKPLTSSLEISVIMYSFGTGIIQLSFSLEAELRRLADLADRAERITLKKQRILDYCRDLSTKLSEKLVEFCTHKYETRFVEDQLYPIFVINSAPRIDNFDEFIHNNRKLILGIVGGESSYGRLSNYAMRKSRVVNFGYYSDELVVIQDSGALIYSKEEKEIILGLIQLAYAQYWALKAYNHLIGVSLDKASKLLAKAAKIRSLLLLDPRLRRLSKEIFEAYEDKLELISTIRDMSNVPKISEDWHLAGIYENVSQTFQIKELFNLVKVKLDEMTRAYESIQNMLTNRGLMTIEIWFLILFVVEIFIFILSLRMF